MEPATEPETHLPAWKRWWQRELEAWNECDREGQTGRHPFRRTVCYFRRLGEAYAIHQCSLMACACAYCAMLSLIPLLVVGIAALGFFLGGKDHAMEDLLKAVRGYVPRNLEFYVGVREVLKHILEQRRLLGIFGLTGLLWAAHQVFLAMQPAMNLVWNVPETRHWIKQRLIAVIASILTILLLGINIAALTLVSSLERFVIPYLPGPVEAFLYRVALNMIPLLLLMLLFAILYKALPDRTVPWKSAFVGATVAAILWQLSLLGFGSYVAHFHSYDRLYGPLGGLVILVVWCYYSMVIMLLGAEITADFETMREGRWAAEERAHSGADLAAATGTDAGHHIAPEGLSGSPPEL